MAKFKNINFKSKKTWKNILIVGLAIITLVGAIVGLSALFRKSEETTKEISPSYAIGGLTEQGAYLETKESIYTKDAFECQGLNVKLAFDNNISYRIFFYDYEDKFVNATENLTVNYDEDVSIFVKSARIVITPNDDSKVSWYEKSGYANQLKIKVNKEQKETYYSNNLYEIECGSEGTYYMNNLNTTGEMGAYVRSTIIDVKEYSKVFVMCNGFSDDAISLVHLASGDADKTIVQSISLSSSAMVQMGDKYYVEIELTDDVCYMAISCISGVDYFVYAK